MRLIFLPCLMLMTCLTRVAPAEEIEPLHISLIHAQNQDINDNLAECQKFRDSLIKIFGYQHYERIGTASATVPPGREIVFTPNWAFEMKVRTDEAAPNLYHYELYQEKKLMLGGKFTPKEQVPFIIRGPQYNQGLLILVVYKGDHAPAAETK